jgi:hypothetical protein
MPITGAAPWTTTTNPTTGKAFASEDEYNAWKGSTPNYSGGIASAAASGAANGGGAAGGAATGAKGSFDVNHDTTYNFGAANLYSPNAPGSTGYDGNFFFGTSTGGDSKTWLIKDETTGQFRPASASEKAQGNSTGMPFEVPSNGGYIDPNTGKITYATSGSAYGTHNNDPRDLSNVTPSAGNQTSQYYYNQDYGLGQTALGIIPMQRDQNGTVTSFYAGTGSGGGKIFSSLAEAQSAVASYKSWYDGQHPAGTPGTQIAPTVPSTGTPAAAAPAQPSGVLTKPGVGETYYGNTSDSYLAPTNAQTNYDNTKGMYGQPTNAQTNYDQTKGTYGEPTNAQAVFNETPNQPTESQQLWQKYSGIYGNPNYLDDYYNTQQQKTQTALERRAASAGVGDSSAAARAVGGIGLDFSNQKLLARQGFTKEGMSEAGAADASGLALTNLRGNLAGSADSQNLGRVTAGQSAAQGVDTTKLGYLTAGQAAAGSVDTGNLAKTVAGQGAANSAENLMINRETGGLSSATALAQDQSALTAAGLSSATASSYASQLAVSQAQWQQAGLTAQQQYQKAQELASSMGVVANSAFNYYLSTKFGGGSTTTSTNPYATGTTGTTGTSTYLNT